MLSKINIQKSIVFLYTSNVESKIPFTIASKRIKYSGVNLTKEIQGFLQKLTDPKIHMEMQRTQNCQNLEKQEQSRTHTS